ncbi:hypothetical protein DUNSADRAFT_1080 [Dunaliella salina]|nr:hypothetical protein DUNSADRAFT_1080 [Dunaliella salina]|eukprot:KAF5839304.1 hypothetical protein DUNSADRAFT_1080 [Dunaliella salina]
MIALSRLNITHAHRASIAASSGSTRETMENDARPMQQLAQLLSTSGRLGLSVELARLAQRLWPSPETIACLLELAVPLGQGAQEHELCHVFTRLPGMVRQKLEVPAVNGRNALKSARVEAASLRDEQGAPKRPGEHV